MAYIRNRWPYRSSAETNRTTCILYRQARTKVRTTILEQEPGTRTENSQGNAAIQTEQQDKEILPGGK